MTDLEKINIQFLLDRIAVLERSVGDHPKIELSFDAYCELIGAGPFNEPAFTIYRCLKANGYSIIRTDHEPGNLNHSNEKENTRR